MEKETLENLVNRQLKPFKKEYNDVKDQPNWFMKYTTTKEEQNKFMDWGVEFLMEKKQISRKLAEIEISWFILNWGLTLEKTEESEKSL